MAEHEVMWIGRRPTSLAPAENPATTEDFASALTAACAACGCEVQDYVAAAGAYGSWLIRFRRDGRLHRLVWNGKDGKLQFERATSGVDWDELKTLPVAQRDLPGFIAGLQAALGDGPATSA